MQSHWEARASIYQFWEDIIQPIIFNFHETGVSQTQLGKGTFSCLELDQRSNGGGVGAAIHLGLYKDVLGSGGRGE